MPYYSFDLVVGEEFKNQGGIILEDIEAASDRAVQLATELSQVKPELQSKGCAVRVTLAVAGEARAAKQGLRCARHRPRSQRGLSYAARSRAGLAALGRRPASQPHAIPIAERRGSR